MVIKSAEIQRIQLSSFFRAINHIAVKNTPLAAPATPGPRQAVHILNCDSEVFRHSIIFRQQWYLRRQTGKLCCVSWGQATKRRTVQDLQALFAA